MSDTDINKLLQMNGGAPGDPAQLVRADEVAAWNEDKARSLASTEGIELTPAHMKAINLLREIYVTRGRAPHARLLANELNEAFAAEGGSKYLYQLFPGGPVAQGSRLAGVPAPHDTRDLSFGSTY
ncbi:MAG: TusE/DsrC/DsvC family sulfur relay protein [Hyphomicrobiaceae bacterium]|nr:TusE/DsrC/DsvC family sulfur relay protein [Hyphomicrobiaceae bacterium]